MVKKNFLYLILLVGGALGCCRSSLEAPKHYILGCTIIDKEGRVLRQYRGGECIFLPNGYVASIRRMDLRFFNAKMRLMWKKRIEPHHQINSSLDNKHLLVINTRSHFFPYSRPPSQNVYFDRFSIYDRKGNEVKYFDMYESWQEVAALTPVPFSPNQRIAHGDQVRFEFSHSNSFYEIPENTAASKNHAFDEGNYIINERFRGLILVLDKELKKILWSVRYEDLEPGWKGAHDVQMQRNGKIILFDNLSFLFSDEKDFSTITELDPLTLKKKILFRAPSPTSFFSKFHGGVQRLSDGGLLITDSALNGVFEVNEWGKKGWSFYQPILHPKTGKPRGFWRARRQDLTSFLENNQEGRF